MTCYQTRTRQHASVLRKRMRCASILLCLGITGVASLLLRRNRREYLGACPIRQRFRCGNQRALSKTQTAFRPVMDEPTTLAWARLVQQLQRRQLPGFARREAQRQAEFDEAQLLAEWEEEAPTDCSTEAVDGESDDGYSDFYDCRGAAAVRSPS